MRYRKKRNVHKRFLLDDDFYFNLKISTLGTGELKFDLPTFIYCIEGEMDIVGFTYVQIDDMEFPVRRYVELIDDSYVLLHPDFDYKLDGFGKVVILELSEFDENLNYFESFNFRQQTHVHKKLKYTPFQSIFNILNPSKIYLLMGPKKPILNYKIRGPDNFSIFLAKTRKGQQHSVHKYTKSTQCFIVLNGEYEINVNNKIKTVRTGQYLEVKPNVNRKFNQISLGTGMLLSIVVGETNIIFPRHVRNEIIIKSPIYKRPFLYLAEKFGLKFE